MDNKKKGYKLGSKELTLFVTEKDSVPQFRIHFLEFSDPGSTYDSRLSRYISRDWDYYPTNASLRRFFSLCGRAYELGYEFDSNHIINGIAGSFTTLRVKRDHKRDFTRKHRLVDELILDLELTPEEVLDVFEEA